MKKSLVSIVVPTKNSASTLETCLKSIKDQTYNNVELIVVDNNSIDNTRDIAKKFTKYISTYGPERSAQRNYGAENATGEYVLFIDSDMVLSQDVVEECVAKMREDEELVGAIAPERSFGEGFWAKCKVLERSFYVGVNWIEAPRFFQKNVFNEFEGYDEKNTGTEDYDLPQRMIKKYGRQSIERISSYIYHNEGRFSLISTMKKKYYYAQKLSQYKSQHANTEFYKKQSSLFQRYILFFSQPRKLLKNPLLSLGMLFMKTSEFVAGGLGYVVSVVKR